MVEFVCNLDIWMRGGKEQQSDTFPKAGHLTDPFAKIM